MRISNYWLALAGVLALAWFVGDDAYGQRGGRGGGGGGVAGGAPRRRRRGRPLRRRRGRLPSSGTASSVPRADRGQSVPGAVPTRPGVGPRSTTREPDEARQAPAA